MNPLDCHRGGIRPLKELCHGISSCFGLKQNYRYFEGNLESSLLR